MDKNTFADICDNSLVSLTDGWQGVELICRTIKYLPQTLINCNHKYVLQNQHKSHGPWSDSGKINPEKLYFKLKEQICICDENFIFLTAMFSKRVTLNVPAKQRKQFCFIGQWSADWGVFCHHSTDSPSFWVVVSTDYWRT